MDCDQEKTWTHAAAEGDLEAYGHLIRLYKDMVFSLSLTILKNRQDAEDLCQDVLVKAFRMLPQYRHEAPLKAWLYRITYHEGLNRLKNLRRTRSTVEIDEAAYSNTSAYNSAVVGLENIDRKKMLHHALDHLSTQDQVLIQAYYFEDLSIREMSEMTGLSESNVKIKLHRSRKILHQVLQKTMADEQAK